ncbi:winged helix-turn-helix transcriptional regulator [Dysgonomonas sp. ZJ279]|uniref:winged helix-turn-helix transcriptional regulator n=1 Tax=Dysgonomonas sp. ZJ279 TaxID=2709796 RepID=UPI0013EE2AE0|nr:helix-turn-helix domain-containing protein [Dysgonomonas sp. ZJ279]
MYERKIPLDFDCGISIAMEVIFSKWKFCILIEINRGITRPKDLVGSVEGITKRVLHQQLKQLEFYKIVERTTYAEVPLRVEYSLTEEGKRVLPILDDINKWGLDFAPKFKEITNSCNG